MLNSGNEAWQLLSASPRCPGLSPLQQTTECCTSSSLMAPLLDCTFLEGQGYCQYLVLGPCYRKCSINIWLMNMRGGWVEEKWSVHEHKFWKVGGKLCWWFLFLSFYYGIILNIFNSRENGVMNPFILITQPQWLSTYGQSCFIYLPPPHWIILKQRPDVILFHL